MSNRPDKDDDLIAAHFGAARAAEPLPSDALMARVLGDAAEVAAARGQDQVVALSAKRPDKGPTALRSKPRFWNSAGGAMAIAASALLGIGLGYTTPETSAIWSYIEFGASESDALDLLGTGSFTLADLEG